MPTEVSLVAQSPEEVLCAVPYLLTFHPEHSLVLVALRQRRVVFTARVDLEHALAECPRLRQVVRSNDADRLILVVYHADPGQGRDGLADVLAEFGEFEITDALVSTGSRWWSLLCDDDACCPPTGTPYDVTSSRFAAHAVASGLPALQSRTELIARVAGPVQAELAAVRQSFEAVLPVLAGWSTGQRQDRVAELVHRFRPQTGLSGTECAELAVLCHDPVARDEVLLGLRRPDAQRQVALWSQVVAHSAAPFEVAPLCLLALVGWLSGNGALQVVCMERAERLNPGFSLLGLLNDIHDQAIPPTHWDNVAA